MMLSFCAVLQWFRTVQCGIFFTLVVDVDSFDEYLFQYLVGVSYLMYHSVISFSTLVLFSGVCLGVRR